MSDNVTDARETSLAYLQKLLPQVAAHAVASAVQSCSRAEIAELVPEAGRRLGIQFYKLEATLAEVLESQATLPVLELGATPRVLLSVKRDQVRVFDGKRAFTLPLSAWDNAPH